MHPSREAFLQAGHTLPNVRRDFPEWHLGRPHYALWALDVETPAVAAAVARAAMHLDGLLLDGYNRQAHITLALCGFPTATPRHPDDYGPARFDAHCQALQALALKPFEIDIGALASFTSAPFLQVDDPDGGIARLHQALGGDHPGGRYLPHTTVGLYAGNWPTDQVQQRLDALPDLPPQRCRVERVSLMHYTATEIGGPLTILADHELGSGRLRWRAPPPFPSASGSAIGG
ncbi:2'-5' RNA ligase family protein [Zoogloea sp.]|uniref:2'-5' RNA ligase family protein n=1 Tax=Zoogloea sp. TaxID=49181 RepID=UPI0025FF8067|nr:2'-5' RNA ligase family protein [Zoogloea sp.]MCK6395190.1 2'-5' RNA ligase family protein [Zoogloea sp.]